MEGGSDHWRVAQTVAGARQFCVRYDRRSAPGGILPGLSGPGDRGLAELSFFGLYQFFIGLKFFFLFGP